MPFRTFSFINGSILYFLPLFWIGLGREVFSQIQFVPDTLKMDTIFFLNGEVKAVKLIDTAYHLVRFLPQKQTKKSKVQEVEKSQVFSLKFSGGQERILYFHDSAIGNVFTVMEAKMFMYGEQEADKNYKNKWPFVIGFVVGASSPIALSNAIALSPIAPALIPLHTLIPAIKINTKKIANKNYLQYDTYLMGYERAARKKNFMHSLLGAGIGLSAGLGTWIILK